MDQPLAASGDRANAASLGRGCAIGYALAGSSGSDGYEFVASHAVPVGQSIVYFLIGLPGIDTVPRKHSRAALHGPLVEAMSGKVGPGGALRGRRAGWCPWSAEQRVANGGEDIGAVLGCGGGVAADAVAVGGGLLRAQPAGDFLLGLGGA